MEKSAVSISMLRKKKEAGEPIVALTAYDYPVAKIVDAAGVDLILVGDSLGMVVLGHPTTVPVTMDEMIHHTQAVTRAVKRAMVVGDMPYGSFHLSEEQTLANALRFIKDAGAGAVKIEGASARRLHLIESMVEAEIPVMGHVGLTPQSIKHLGRFKMAGKTDAEAELILQSAVQLEQAGVFAVILECIPMELAGIVTNRLTVPTIGIGAGPHCDGQILVFHDLVGFNNGYLPKFVKKYADLQTVLSEAVGGYAADVREGRFPEEIHSYHRKKNENGEKKEGQDL
ncbi:MAG: 3-methyl-2-oxobutanoate hydroxymethyltransferase [Acidobacteria bacterium]|nr:3-methyl-2-oxobutanoate hydroxymethyltransferase [Acidobacteriota bacterium]MBU1338586.1 3-methyl-2-oxobutanoate hydroxymethyltransferase [Acidobacteriota bacterium]MBU1475649.1 3-methyl-2-oxobutanoate hydroxymethyltransferase [Acidobacteriota bacterium]MBU2437992.1 3-methyl-2-oxobutanoate hydroxymethyltransferase [Acidobacteriota bacterium]MBU4253758.1 3-methyl-2-oxobutanoate hydroxymethyltransferase [Acidobacteriota bacterium]